MRILIIGAGVVGNNLAQELSEEGHDISIIDQDAEKIRRISDTLDVLSIQGNACLPSVLVRAGIKNMEMVIAVTNRDEINLLVCFLASKFNIPNRFARLRSMEFTGNDKIFSPAELYIDQAINPGQIIVDMILKIIKTPGAVNVAEFAGGEILLREFEIPETAPLAGKKIREIREIASMDSFLIVAIVREGKFIIPKPDDVITAKDKIYTLVARDFLPFLLPMLSRAVEAVESIVIYGANPISINLAKALEKTSMKVCIIEPDREEAHFAAEQLSETMVHHGSGTDMNLFNEININKTDIFMSVTEDDENNILAALLAKKNGAKRALVITNDPEYLPILDSIGMDITINPRLITVSAILKYLRKGQVTSVYKLIEDAEVLEIRVDAESSIVNKKISKIKFPEDAIIGTILRKGEMMVPDGEVVIQPDDSVIVVALPQSIEKIENLFGRRRYLLPFR